MESANIQTLYDEWQSAVRAHVNLFREARMRGLTTAEIEEIAPAYVLRIDAAYARLKEAEAREAANSEAQLWLSQPSEATSAASF